MEKRQAQEYIGKILRSRFDQEQFELFIRNLLNEYEPKSNSYSGNLIPEAFREHISHYKRIGKYTDPEGEPLDILIIQTRSVKKLERARTALRNFVVRHLKTFEKQYALAAFYSKEDAGAEWRLSLVKIDYESQRNEDGKIKVKEDLVPAKRFSFLVGENEDAYTAQKQLLPLLTNDHANPLVVAEKSSDGSIEGAFSVEKVTREFYEQYKELYLKLTENTSLIQTLEQEGLDPVRFVKKLLGQIVFLYFLQKKGWLGVPKNGKMGEGSKRFLQDRFELSVANGQNYFNEFLRYLFYEALAHEHHDEGVKYYFKQLDCKIPFLNGGLFEADYDWEKATLDIPNSYFRNNERNKAGDKGTGILDVFDRYNFTIKEDEPLEKEVAVDPEMLGKVFENLLDIKDRKSKGAFYTPREIVHYMCQESLIHYLDNAVNEYTESYQALDTDQTSLFGGSKDKKGNLPDRQAGLKIELENKGDIRVPKKDIEQFIRYGHLALEHETTVAGKGKETSAYKFKLPESIRKHAGLLDNALADIKICDPAIGSGAFPVGLLHEIVTARLVLNSFLQNPKHTPYYLKRHAIKESIYGVDIDASAIDIARLRLWLSMIVDEEDYDRIEALPNLDYKIVCGNSLIGLPENAMRDLAVEEDLEKLKEIFFHETDESKKKKLRQQINTKIRQLLDSAEQFAGYEIDFDFKLYFSEVWHQKDGFDVVIGNPPYVSIYSIPEYDKKVYSKVYKTAYKKYDLYVLFFEKGLSLLRYSGTINLITSNKYFSQPYGLKLRQEFLKNRILELINFRFNVFAATVDTAITHLAKCKPLNIIEILDINDKKSFDKFLNKNRVKLNLDFIKKLPDNLFRIEVSNIDIEILNTIQDKSFPFSEICYVNYGCRLVNKSGTKKKKDYIFSENEKNIFKPFIEGSDIRKYKIISSRYVDFQPTEHYLSLFPELFNNIKLVSKDVVGKDGLSVAFDEVGYYDDHTTINAVRWCDLEGVNYSGVIREITAYRIKLSEKYSYFELLGYINSEVSNYYFNKLYNIDLHFYPGTFQKMVVPKDSSKELAIIVHYIKIVLENEIEDNIASFFISISNLLVYELYFPDKLKSAGKEFIKYLGDLKPITDDMTDEEKLAVIRSEFERLYDPNHPVRNNLETLDSVEEVRIIREALK